MTHPNFPYQNDSEDLRDYVWDWISDYYQFKDKSNGLSEKQIKSSLLKLIKENKREWCKRQKENCADAYLDNENNIYEAILNAPEP
jgi:hypothetical protein